MGNQTAGQQQPTPPSNQNSNNNNVPNNIPPKPKPKPKPVIRIPILKEDNVKFFGKRWRSDQVTFKEGTLSLCTDGSIMFVNKKNGKESTIPVSSLKSIGECTITIDYPVTLIVVSYIDDNNSNKNLNKNIKKNLNKPIEAAFLIPNSQQIWLEILQYQTKLQPQNIVLVPECPICLMESDNYTYLINCNHMICQLCLLSFIKADLKNAAKYPMKCFNFKCNALLHHQDVQFAFNALPDAKDIKKQNQNQNNDDNKDNNAVNDDKKNDNDNKDDIKDDNKDDNKDNDNNDNKDNVNDNQNQNQKQKNVNQIGNNYAILCQCGNELKRIDQNPYNPQKPITHILCDICLTQINDGSFFYHCGMDTKQNHPDGYDLCSSCAGVRQQTQNLTDDQIPNCSCNDKLIPLMSDKCYPGSKKTSCNECRQTFEDVVMWHCSKGFDDNHEHGYDLCVECAVKYIDNDIDNDIINQQKKQKELELQQKDIQLIASHQGPKINYAQPTSKQDFTAIYGKFSVLSAIPSTERDNCPNCSMIFFSEPRLKKQDHHKWVKNIDNKKNCSNPKCLYKFVLIIDNKNRCMLCGDIFCDKCINYQLPLQVGSDGAQKKYIAMKKVEIHKSQQSWIDNVTNKVTNLFKSDDEKFENELKLEKQQLLRTTSDEKKDIIINTDINCCELCWFQYYRGYCMECFHEYCIECRKPWHPNFDCYQDKKQKQKDNNLKLNQEFFKKQGFIKCPRCGMMIEKTSGCNAISHKCKKNNETKQINITVCYCCGEHLKDHDHEQDGTNHWPDGPFAICRKKKGKK